MDNSQRTLIFGAKGQVGSALASILPGSIALDQPDVDFLKPEEIVEILDRHHPHIVFNAVAYTDVERAEEEEDVALVVNAKTPAAIARWCAKNQACFIHFSTDYVFGNKSQRPWLEDDPPSPMNTYGRTKTAGDIEVSSAGSDFLIFRTSWLYDWKGRNFLTKMLKLGGEYDVLRVVDDQFGAPTFAPHLAQGVVHALEVAKSMPQFPAGVYNLCNRGETTWFGFTIAIFDAAAGRSIPLSVKRVEAITTEEYGGSVNRPRNSRLSTEKAKRIFGVELPAWEEGLKECMGHL